VDHRILGYRYDTIDPECRPIIKSRLKDLKDRFPKEVVRKEFKEGLSKELKEALPKELKDRTPKEFKEGLPKELRPKEFKEGGPKEFKEIREVPGTGDPFIRPELRPDLSGAALSFEPDLNPDVAALREALAERRTDLGGQG
jgi:hypothetical protein